MEKGFGVWGFRVDGVWGFSGLGFRQRGSFVS